MSPYSKPKHPLVPPPRLKRRQAFRNSAIHSGAHRGMLIGLAAAVLFSSGCAVSGRNPPEAMVATFRGINDRASSVNRAPAVDHRSAGVRPPPTIRQVGHAAQIEGSTATRNSDGPDELKMVDTASDQFPIDLPTALQLAGANNLQIVLAQQKVGEAMAKRSGAEAIWIPSFVAGAVYSHHDGRVQNTDGTIIDVERNARFVGGGPNLGAFPLTGPGGPPARLALGLPLADVMFAPLAERQMVVAAQAASDAAFNDALLQVCVAYFDLVQAQGGVAIAEEAVRNANELERLIVSRVRAGTAPPADEMRARVEVAERGRQRLAAGESVQVASAELARLLRLDPTTALFAMESAPAPIELVNVDRPLPELLAHGLATRPELTQYRAIAQATLDRYQQERTRVWLPTAQVGFSAGGMGGGTDASSDGLEGRTDFDAAMVWELRNLGFGNRALQRERWSQHRQAETSVEQLIDSVSAEIVAAYYQVHSRQEQVEVARSGVAAATESVPLNFKGILGGELRAIEAQQAIQALAQAQKRYLDSVVDFNRAQCQLLRAIGTAPLDSIAAAR